MLSTLTLLLVTAVQLGVRDCAARRVRTLSTMQPADATGNLIRMLHSGHKTDELSCSDGHILMVMAAFYDFDVLACYQAASSSAQHFDVTAELYRICAQWDDTSSRCSSKVINDELFASVMRDAKWQPNPDCAYGRCLTVSYRCVSGVSERFVALVNAFPNISTFDRAAQLVEATRMKLETADLQVALHLIGVSCYDSVSLTMNATTKQTTTENLLASASSLIDEMNIPTWNALETNRSTMHDWLVKTVDAVGFASLALANESNGYGSTLRTKKVLLATELITLSSYEQNSQSSGGDVNRTKPSGDETRFTEAIPIDAHRVSIAPLRIANAHPLSVNRSLHVVYTVYSDVRWLFVADSTNSEKNTLKLAATYQLASDVLNVALRADGEAPFTSTRSRDGKSIIRFVLQSTTLNFEMSGAQPVCAYWHYDQMMHAAFWSTEGCSLVESNATHISCECAHLTSFAVLVDYTGASLSLGEPHATILMYVTLVGCVLSCVCLVLTIAAFCTLRVLRTVERNRINKQLCASLLCAMVLFIIGALHDFAQYGSVVCTAVGAALHYALLVTFVWFAVEGVYLYITLVLVFRPRHVDVVIKCFYLVAYGLPALVVITTASGWAHAYGTVNSRNFCWLRAEAGSCGRF